MREYFKKIIAVGIGAFLLLAVCMPSYAYELLDKDGDGEAETVRFCDGYEKEALFNYIGVLATDMDSRIIHYDWLERDDEICQRYPGELQLAEEYLEKVKVVSQENTDYYNKLYYEYRNYSDNWWEQLEMYGRLIDSKFKNIDENALGFMKESDIKPDTGSPDWKDHYSGYGMQKVNYCMAVEENKFLKGEFPVPEAEYRAFAQNLYMHAFSDIPGYRYYMKSFNYFLVDNEWWEVETYGTEELFPLPTKGISEKGIQNMLDKKNGAVVSSRNGDPAFRENLPLEVQQRLKEFYKD